MIRHATCLDRAEVLELCREFYPHTSYAKWAPFDEESVLEQIDRCTKTGIMLVAQIEDKLVGIIGMVAGPFIFNKDLISATELIWWIQPEHRKSGLGIELVKRADILRKLKGWKSFQMIRLEESDPRLDEVYVSLGFSPTEHCFTKVN